MRRKGYEEWGRAHHTIYTWMNFFLKKKKEVNDQTTIAKRTPCLAASQTLPEEKIATPDLKMPRSRGKF